MPPKPKVMSYVMMEEKDETHQPVINSTTEDSEKRIRRETQQRLQRIEQQKLDLEQQEVEKKQRLAEQKRQQYQHNNQNLHARTKSPFQIKQDGQQNQQKQTVANEFQKYLLKVQEQIGEFNQPIMSMDMSYLQNEADDVQKIQKSKELMQQPSNRVVSARTIIPGGSVPKQSNHSTDNLKVSQKLDKIQTALPPIVEQQMNDSQEYDNDIIREEFNEVGKLPTFNENSDSDKEREDLIRSQHLEKRQVSYQLKSPEARQIQEMRNKKQSKPPVMSKQQQILQRKPPVSKSQPPKPARNPATSGIVDSKAKLSNSKVDGAKPTIKDSISLKINQISKEEAALERELMGIDKKLRNDLTEEDLFDNVSIISHNQITSPKLPQSQLSVFDDQSNKPKIPTRQQLKKSLQSSVQQSGQQNVNDEGVELDEDGNPMIPKDVQVKIETEYRQQQSRNIINQSLQNAKVNQFQVVKPGFKASKSVSTPHQHAVAKQQQQVQHSSNDFQTQKHTPNQQLLQDMFGVNDQQHRAVTPKMESSLFLVQEIENDDQSQEHGSVQHIPTTKPRGQTTDCFENTAPIVQLQKQQVCLNQVEVSDDIDDNDLYNQVQNAEVEEDYDFGQ